jgi:hypothetical protein
MVLLKKPSQEVESSRSPIARPQRDQPASSRRQPLPAADEEQLQTDRSVWLLGFIRLEQ